MNRVKEMKMPGTVKADALEYPSHARHGLLQQIVQEHEQNPNAVGQGGKMRNNDQLKTAEMEKHEDERREQHDALGAQGQRFADANDRPELDPLESLHGLHEPQAQRARRGLAEPRLRADPAENQSHWQDDHELPQRRVLAVARDQAGRAPVPLPLPHV